MTIIDALMFLVILAGFGLCLAIGVNAIRDARRQR
jgi:hypothetical protein